MNTDQANIYLQNRVLTASREELHLMLIDGAIRFGQLAKEGLIEKDYDKGFTGFEKCQAIILELINGLRPEHAPDLCKRLSGLYTFMYRRLVDACTQRDVAIVDEVLNLLAHERETWVMLMKKLSEERRGESADASHKAINSSVANANPTATHNNAPPGTNGSSDPGSSLSVSA